MAPVDRTGASPLVCEGQLSLKKKERPRSGRTAKRRVARKKVRINMTNRNPCGTGSCQHIKTKAGYSQNHEGESSQGGWRWASLTIDFELTITTSLAKSTWMMKDIRMQRKRELLKRN